MTNDKQVFFSPPNGSEITNPDPERLKELILLGGPSYWIGSSGDAGITYVSGDVENQLILIFNEKYGFHLIFIGDESLCVIVDENASEEDIEVIVGGDPTNITICQFVPRADTWEAVRVFIDSGEKSDKLNWVEQH